MHCQLYDRYMFKHNGDYSGGVEISDGEFPDGIKVPMEVLLEFVADYVRKQKISKLEAATEAEILGL